MKKLSVFVLVLAFFASKSAFSSSRMLNYRAAKMFGACTGLAGTAFLADQYKKAYGSEKVLIYHTTSSEASLRSIKRSGLRSGEGAALAPLSFIRFCKDSNHELSINDCAYYYLRNRQMCINNT